MLTRFNVIWLQLKRFAELRPCTMRISFLEFGEPQIVMGFSVFGPQSQGLAQLAQCLVDFSLSR